MIPLREWETRSIGAGFTRSTADALLAVARASPLGGIDGARILVDGGRYVRAQNVVGVIATPNFALEILPKIDGASDDTGIRQRLIHMLAVVYDLDVSTGAATPLGYQQETLLEILIRLFTDQLIEAVRRGLPRRYVALQDDLPVLRGRLDVTRQFTTFAGNATRLACHYDPLSSDIALNRAIKAAITYLRRLAQHPETARRLSELDFAYSGVSDAPRNSLFWDDISIDRTNERWRPILRFARLLLSDRFQTTSTGSTLGTALLFDMGKLFEGYLTRCFSRALVEMGCQVVAQGGGRYCLTEVDSDGHLSASRFQTRPDILIKRKTHIEAVIDAKWKRLAGRSADARHGVSHTDIYQMMAYGRLYRAPHLMLVYPHNQNLDAASGVLSRYSVAGFNEQLVIATVDLTDVERVVGQLRKMLANAIPHLGVSR